MKKRLLLLLAATIFLISGCNGEREDVKDLTRSYYAAIEDDVTKLYLNELHLLWNSGDRIALFEGNTSLSEFSFSGTDGTSSGPFTSITTASSGTSLTANYAYFPYSSEVSVSPSGVISAVIPSLQTRSSETVSMNQNPMAAVSSGISDHRLSFKNVCGVLKISIKGSGSIKTIALTGNSGEILAGPAEITVSYGSAPSVGLSEDGYGTITLDCGAEGAALNTETATDFYFIVPPRTFSAGFTVLITDTEGKWMSKSTSRSQTISRSTILSMDEFTFEPYTPISAIRELYSGSEVTIPDGVKIRATVISNFRDGTRGGLSNSTKTRVIVSDGGKGLCLYLPSENTNFALGDELEVNLSGQKLDSFNGMLEIVNIYKNKITKTEVNKPLEAVPATVEGLLAGNFDLMYVSVPNVQTASSTPQTFVNGASDTEIDFVSLTNQPFVLYSSKNSTFGAQTVPTGSGTLKGIFMQYSGKNEIIITSLSDVADLTGSRFGSGGGGEGGGGSGESGVYPDWITPDRVNSWMELPVVTMTSNAAYVSHYASSANGTAIRNYSMLYDGNYKLAIWVAYPLSRDYIGTVKRTDAWAFDPKIPQEKQPDVKSGTYGVYATDACDRGHQLPSASRTASTDMNEATFYVSNMTAQHKYLNQRIWVRLEDFERTVASSNDCDTLYIVTGPVLTTESDPVVHHIKDKSNLDVALPQAYFKVLLKYNKASNTYSSIGFWFNNEAYTTRALTSSDTHSVSWIQSQTGLTFFTNLPPDTRRSVIEQWNPSAWGL